jgi:hypothetical protein
MHRVVLAVALLCAGISQASAGLLGFVVPSIPTLDETGLIGLSIVIGIVAGIAARRRNKK